MDLFVQVRTQLTICVVIQNKLFSQLLYLLYPPPVPTQHWALSVRNPNTEKSWKPTLSRYRKLLDELNLDTWNSESPAVPIVLGKKEKVYYFWKALLEKGVYAIISVAPGVPPGKDLIRTAISAAHTEEDFDLIEEAFRYAVTKI